MGKIVGIVLLFLGIGSGLYQWIELQRERQMRIEEFCLFLYKSMFLMQSEKIKVIEHFDRYTSRDAKINESLQEISIKLRENLYPDGQVVWEEVIKEKVWDLDQETMLLILKSGNGFFGRNREENICFLKRQLEELEKQKIKSKERDAKERKVWVPVGMLSGVMVVILFM